MSHTNTNKTKKKRNINNRIQSKKLNYNMDGGALDAKQIATIEAQEQQWIRIINSAVNPYQAFMADKIKYDLITQVLENLTMEQDKAGAITTIGASLVKTPASLTKRLINRVKLGNDEFSYYRSKVRDLSEEFEDKLQDARIQLANDQLFQKGNNINEVKYKLAVSNLTKTVAVLSQINKQLADMSQFIQTQSTGGNTTAIQARLEWILIDGTGYGLSKTAGTQADSGFNRQAANGELLGNLNTLKAQYNTKIEAFDKAVSGFQSINFKQLLDDSKTLLEKTNDTDPDKGVLLKYLSMVYVIINLGYYSPSTETKFDLGSYIRNRPPGLITTILEKIQDSLSGGVSSSAISKADNFEHFYAEMTLLNANVDPSNIQIDGNPLLNYGMTFDKDEKKDLNNITDKTIVCITYIDAANTVYGLSNTNDGNKFIRLNQDGVDKDLTTPTAATTTTAAGVTALTSPIICIRKLSNTLIVVAFTTFVEIRAVASLEVKKTSTLNAAVNDVQCSSDGTKICVFFGTNKFQVFTITDDGTAFTVTDGPILSVKTTNTSSVFDYSPQTTGLVVSTTNKKVAFYDLTTRKSKVSPAVTTYGNISSIAYNPDGTLVVVSTTTLVDYKVTNNDLSADAKIPLHLNITIEPLTIEPLEPNKQNISVFNSGSADKLFDFWATGGPVKNVRFSPDGQMIMALVNNTTYCPLSYKVSAYITKYATDLAGNEDFKDAVVLMLDDQNNDITFEIRELVNNNTTMTTTGLSKEVIEYIAQIPAFIYCIIKQNKQIYTNVAIKLISLIRSINVDVFDVQNINSTDSDLTNLKKPGAATADAAADAAIITQDQLEAAKVMIQRGKANVDSLYKELTQVAGWNKQLNADVIKKINTLTLFYAAYVQVETDLVGFSNVQFFSSTNGAYIGSLETDNSSSSANLFTYGSTSNELITTTATTIAGVITAATAINIYQWSKQYDLINELYINPNNFKKLAIFSTFFNGFQQNLDSYLMGQSRFFAPDGIGTIMITDLPKIVLESDPQTQTKAADFNDKLTMYKDGFVDLPARHTAYTRNINQNPNSQVYFQNPFDTLNYIVGSQKQLRLETATDLKLDVDYFPVISNEAIQYTGDYYRTYEKSKIGNLVGGDEKSYKYMFHGYGYVYYRQSPAMPEAEQGMSYKGFFKKGRFNGYGELAYGENMSGPNPNPNLAFVRRGYWKNNVFEGPGIEYTGKSALSNKIKFIGNFINDVRYGMGMEFSDDYDFTKKTGTITSGYWVAGNIGWLNDLYTIKAPVTITQYAEGKELSQYTGFVRVDDRTGSVIEDGKGVKTVTEYDGTNVKSKTTYSGNFIKGKLSGPGKETVWNSSNAGKNNVIEGTFLDGEPVETKSNTTDVDGTNPTPKVTMLRSFDKDGKPEVDASGKPKLISEANLQPLASDTPEQTEVKTKTLENIQKAKDTADRKVNDQVIVQKRDVAKIKGTELPTEKTSQEVEDEITTKKNSTEERLRKQETENKDRETAMGVSQQIAEGKFVKLDPAADKVNEMGMILFDNETRYIGPVIRDRNTLKISKKLGRLESDSGNVLIPPDSKDDSVWANVVLDSNTEKYTKDKVDLPPQWVTYRPDAIFNIIPKDSAASKVFGQDVTDALWTVSGSKTNNFIGDDNTLKQMQLIIFRDIVIYVQAYIMVISSILGPGAPGVMSTALKCTGTGSSGSSDNNNNSSIEGGGLGQIGGAPTQKDVDELKTNYATFKQQLDKAIEESKQNLMKNGSNPDYKILNDRLAENINRITSELDKIPLEISRGETYLTASVKNPAEADLNMNLITELTKEFGENAKILSEIQTKDTAVSSAALSSISSPSAALSSSSSSSATLSLLNPATTTTTTSSGSLSPPPSPSSSTTTAPNYFTGKLSEFIDPSLKKIIDEHIDLEKQLKELLKINTKIIEKCTEDIKLGLSKKATDYFTKMKEEKEKENTDIEAQITVLKSGGTDRNSSLKFIENSQETNKDKIKNITKILDELGSTASITEETEKDMDTLKTVLSELQDEETQFDNIFQQEKKETQFEEFTTEFVFIERPTKYLEEKKSDIKDGNNIYSNADKILKNIQDVIGKILILDLNNPDGIKLNEIIKQIEEIIQQINVLTKTLNDADISTDNGIKGVIQGPLLTDLERVLLYWTHLLEKYENLAENTNNANNANNAKKAATTAATATAAATTTAATAAATTAATTTAATTTAAATTLSPLNQYLTNLLTYLQDSTTPGETSVFQQFKSEFPQTIPDLSIPAPSAVKNILNAIIASVSTENKDLLTDTNIDSVDKNEVLLIINKNIIILFSMYLIIISKLTVKDPFLVLNMYNGFRASYDKLYDLIAAENSGAAGVGPVETSADEILANENTVAFIKSILLAIAFSVTAGGISASASGMLLGPSGGKKYTKRRNVVKRQYKTKRQRKLNLKGKKYVTRKMLRKKYKGKQKGKK